MNSLIRRLPVPPRVRLSLAFAWKEGIPANVMIALTDYYLIPLALFLGARPQEIGLLVALPQVVGSLTQLFAVRLLDRAGSRLKFLVLSTAAQAALLVPIALLAVTDVPYRLLWFALLLIAFRSAGYLIGTVFGSLVSDHLSAELRGRYLGARSRVAGLAGIAAMVAGGIFLNAFEKISTPAAFLILFLIAAAGRTLSAYFMSRMEDLPLEKKTDADFSFLRFLARFRESNFVHFVFYVAALNFATAVAAPYFSVYMLRDLGFNYFTYMAVHLASVSASLVAYPLWGRDADEVGNAKVLQTTGLLIPLIPLLWSVWKQPALLIGVEFFSGFVWGGFNLCAVNFIYDAVRSDKRVRCIGYYNLINGFAVCAGAAFGGFLAERLVPIKGSPLCTLFLISALLRLGANAALSGGFKEVRSSARRVSRLKLFFSVTGIRRLPPREPGWDIVPDLEKSEG